MFRPRIPLPEYPCLQPLFFFFYGIGTTAMALARLPPATRRLVSAGVVLVLDTVIRSAAKYDRLEG